MDDMDAALARSLQQEELLSAKFATANGLLSQLQGCMDKVTKCEDELLQTLALSILPLDELRAEAEEALLLNASLGEALQLAHEDVLAQKLLNWFKTKFFTWTDNPACHVCGSKDTKNVGTEAPTPEEKQHEASRTEVYRCTACDATTRFPRYNDTAKLLETRTGRCGEWANCFLLILRSAGLTARYILDVTDHVWCEYHSSKLGRWVHLDPCEAAFDKPLLYEAGWGKKLSYVFAIGTSGFVDVMPRYTRKYAEVRSRRTLLPDAELRAKLEALTQQIRLGLPEDVLTSLQVRDLAEQMELLGCSTSTADADSLTALPGRMTGSLQWRQERGEMGDAPQTSGTQPREAAAYQAARDKALGPVFEVFGRLCGGACRAAGENPPEESAAMGFDGRMASKWLDFGGAGQGGTTWLEYRLLADQPAAVVVSYDLVSGDDCPERDPCSWVLEGLQEGASAGSSQDATWTTLDERAEVTFGARHELHTFVVDPTRRGPCRSLRLRITKSRGPTSATCIQLSCLNLYAAPTAAIFSLRTPLPTAAQAAEAFAAAANAGTSSTVDERCTSTMYRLLSNIEASPSDAKFRRVRASRLPPALLQRGGPAVTLLAAVGFRPLLLQLDSAVAAPGEEPFLVFAAGEGHVQAVTEALAVLRAQVPALSVVSSSPSAS